MSDIVPSESAEDRGERVDRLLRHVRPIVLASARVVEGHVQGYGWTVGSRAVLQVLVEGGAATVPQIAARLDLARQNVQRHVDALVELGHVARRANPEHRRSVLIEPTPEGRSTFATMHATELGELASLARACTMTELAVAEAVLASLEHDIRARASGREAEAAVEQR
jgi:DNA-binding MarR family transcriptional regulator